jgi:hypothetical protein
MRLAKQSAISSTPKRDWFGENDKPYPGNDGATTDGGWEAQKGDAAYAGHAAWWGGPGKRFRRSRGCR